jgi:hypothetical protein
MWVSIEPLDAGSSDIGVPMERLHLPFEYLQQESRLLLHVEYINSVLGHALIPQAQEGCLQHHSDGTEALAVKMHEIWSRREVYELNASHGCCEQTYRTPANSLESSDPER